MRTETGQLIRLQDYRQTDHAVDAVALEFDLHPTATIVRSTLSIRRRDTAEADAPLVLDGEDLELLSVSVNGKKLAEAQYTLDKEHLTLTALPAEATFGVEIETRINPQANKQLMGLYRTAASFCTQCEAEGFRRITFFPDRPDVLSVYSVKIIGDKAREPLLLSNGNCTQRGELAHGRHFAIWEDPHPKPSYLFALFAGDLGVVRDRFVTMSGRDVELAIYVEHGKEPRATYAMDALKRSMKWDEEAFGREYDLDIFMIVAVSDFNMGAMENKGLNIFNDKYVLADPETATDGDYANIEAIIAHEYFHNWTGNRITCRDWFQLCLKEGLTVYRDHEFSADMRSRGVKRVNEVRGLRAHQFSEDAGPLAHPVRPRTYREINNFYTATVYEKGSEVVRMLRTLLGPEGFKAGMDLYFDRHDGDAATIEDFLACFSEATGTDLTQFALWYDQPGTPNVRITTRYDAKTRTFSATLAQSLKAPVKGGGTEPMHIPVEFGLVGHNGEDLDFQRVDGGTVTGNVMHLCEREQTFVFHGVAQKPVLSAFRGFSAPVTTVPEPADGDLAFLARHDSDGFNRWQALNTLMMRRLRAAATGAQGGDAAAGEDALAIMEAIAQDDTLEPAYRALCLTLPSEADVAREIGHNINPDRVHAAVLAMSKDIARSLKTTFARLERDMRPTGPYSPEAADAGQRNLANAALSYVCLAENDVAVASARFGSADNMSDRMAALSIMAMQAPEDARTQAALDAFHERHADDAMVLDKWLMVQAMMPGDGALSRVKALMESPAFTLENPNRVRALIGAFATGNATGFNRPDGAGYRFLCETARTIDGFNPQVAARLMTAMRSWRTLERGRMEAARDALSALDSANGLSRDLRDIVERTLA